jgi:hypothetical protein
VEEAFATSEILSQVMQPFVQKVQNSCITELLSLRKISHPINHLLASKVPSCVQARTATCGEPCHSSATLGRWPMRSEDLLKPDVISEVILVGTGALLFVVLIVILAIVVTQPSAPV